MPRNKPAKGTELVVATEDLCETESEELFVRLCTREDFPCYRIPVDSKNSRKRPDFLVQNVGVFEIKEVAATDKEHEIARQRQPRRMTMKDRHKTIHYAICSACRQLEYAKERELPGVVVLHIHDHVLFNHLDLEICSFGERGVGIIYDENTMEPVAEPREVAGGAHILLTPRSNTRISAIALLSEYPSDDINSISKTRIRTKGPRIWMLHSPFAKVPLDPMCFQTSTITHSQYVFDAKTGLVNRVDGAAASSTPSESRAK